jgi:hypothetical protein
MGTASMQGLAFHHGKIVGDLVIGGLRRRTKRTDGWSRVEHISQVLYRYGPQGEQLYGRPICGGESGRIGTHYVSDPVCKSCLAAAERRGLRISDG